MCAVVYRMSQLVEQRNSALLTLRVDRTNGRPINNVTEDMDTVKKRRMAELYEARLHASASDIAKKEKAQGQQQAVLVVRYNRGLRS